MNRVFSGFAPTTRDFPPINIWLGENSVVVTGELAGVTQDDVSINLQEDVLTLEGARRPTQQQDVNWQRRERAYATFRGSSSCRSGRSGKSTGALRQRHSGNRAPTAGSGPAEEDRDQRCVTLCVTPKEGNANHGPRSQTCRLLGLEADVIDVIAAAGERAHRLGHLARPADVGPGG
jgi:Hsp20/alpha crystallin family protein